MNDMYNDYDNVELEYGFPMKKPFGSTRSSSPTYTMDYGDTALIPFQIPAEYRYWDIYIKIYNFRYEEVCEPLLTYCDWASNIYLRIDKDLSQEVFKRGIYYCQIQAVNNRENEEEQQECNCISGEQVVTLVPASACSIYVK